MSHPNKTRYGLAWCLLFSGQTERHTMKVLTDPQSGSQAGTTASRNRFGQYTRSRATPVNPNTSAQQNARNRLTQFSQAWRGLTDVQRAAWESYALNHPFNDALGQQIFLTGHQSFISVNTALDTAGLASVTEPDLNAPDNAPEQGATTITVAGFSIAFGTNPVPADTALILESSPPLSAGRSFNSDFRIVKVRAAAAANTLLKADMEAKWGALAAGQKFFIRASTIGDTGLRSAFTAVSVVVT
jgi:hypothetical protein